MNAYDTHIRRLATDDSYANGFDYGKTGGSADANPWALGDEHGTAWSAGWRTGSTFHGLAATSPDVEAALRAAMDAGDID